MFVRFRQTKRRLQVSLVENRRGDGRVRQEHIAWLGTIATASSIDDRIAFWRQLHERLATLTNRVEFDTQTKVLADIHARIPMPMLEEQHDLKLENAEADERLWTSLREMHEEQAEGQRQLIANAERAIANNTTAYINHARLLAGMPESTRKAMVDVHVEASERAGRAAVRRFVRHLLELLNGAA